MSKVENILLLIFAFRSKFLRFRMNHLDFDFRRKLSSPCSWKQRVYPSRFYCLQSLNYFTERAMAHCGSNEVLIVGGVGCLLVHNDLIFEKVLTGNLRLQEMMRLQARFGYLTIQFYRNHGRGTWRKALCNWYAVLYWQRSHDRTGRLGNVSDGAYDINCGFYYHTEVDSIF